MAGRTPKRNPGLFPVKTVLFSTGFLLMMGLFLVFHLPPPPEKGTVPHLVKSPRPEKEKKPHALPQTEPSQETPHQPLEFKIPDEELPQETSLDLFSEMVDDPVWNLGDWDFADTDAVSIGPRNQTVLDVGDLPPGNYLLHLVLTPDSRHSVPVGYPWLYRFPADEPSDSPLRLGEFLVLELNGNRIHSLWRAGHEYRIRALLPGTALHPSDNRLLIHNNSSDFLGVDCAWIEPVRPGERLEVVLEGAAWITNPGIASDIACIGFTLDPQLLSAPITHPRHRPQNHPLFTSARPMTLDERRQIWSDCFRSGPPHGANKRQIEFHNELHRILSLDAEPHLNICSIRGATSEDLEPFLVLYAPFIQSWTLLPDSSSAADKVLIDGIRQHSPGATLTCQQIPGTSNTRHDMPTTLSWHSTNQFLKTLEYQNDMRIRAAEAGLLPVMLKHPGIGTELRSLGGGSLNDQLKKGLEIPEFAVGSLAEGASQILIDQVNAGENVFLWGDSAPGIAWETIRFVARFGRNQAQRWPVNIVPASGDWGLAHARCIGAIDPEGRIQILLFTGTDSGRELKLSVPVTSADQDYLVTLEGVEIAPSNSITPHAKAKTRVKPETIGTRTREGLLTFTCKPPTLAFFTLRPESVPLTTPRITRLPIQHHPHHLNFNRYLFRTPRTSALDGYWIAELWPEAPLINPLDPTTEIETETPATPGVVNGIQNIVPWAKTSGIARLQAPQAANRPCGAVIQLSKVHHTNPEILEFWVRATSSRGLSRVPFRAGSPSAGGEILIPTGEWVCVQCDWGRLYNDRDTGLLPLYLYPVPDHPAYQGQSNVTFEINGPVSKSKRAPDTATMACKFVTEKPRSQRTSTEKITRAFVFARPRSAFRLAKRFDIPTFTGQVQTSYEDVECEYRPESQLLLVNAEDVPPLAEFDPEEWSGELPANYRQACRRHGLFPIEITQRPNLEGMENQ